MTMRPLLRAALLASALAAASACSPTPPDPGQPDAGPGDVLPDAGPGSDKTPTGPDADGDGLVDALEDKNANGRLDDGETDAHSKDSDCDGLLDGPGAGGVPGEDLNANGVVDPGETNPRVRDSDGDGLTDGVERGVTANVEPGHCASVAFDADPGTTTDPTASDSDGDGIADGAEDTNQDGKVEPGELDPKNGTDGTGPAAQACTADKLRPVAFRTEGDADLQLALPAAPRFAEVMPLTVGGAKVGFMGYDSASQVAFLLYRQTPPRSDVTLDEGVLRLSLAKPGAFIGTPLTQNFKTWDGYSALKAQYEQSGSTGVKARANALADALLGAGTGSLSTQGDVVGSNGFRLQAEYIHRSDKSLVVLVALTPRDASGQVSGTPLFTVNDLNAGASVAQFADTTAVQCEAFNTGNAKVDFLFVVDDSGSMATSQGSLAASADAVARALRSSSLDWRVALVTTNYAAQTSNTNYDKLRPFTNNINQLKAWLKENSACSASSPSPGNSCSLVSPTAEEPTAPYCPGDASWGSNGGCWVGKSGTGSEGILGAARKMVNVVTSSTTPAAQQARPDAKLVVILLGDADDQTKNATSTLQNCGGDVDTAGSGCESVENFKTFFTTRSVPVHGIVCPSGSYCGCTSGPCTSSNASEREFNPQPINGVSQLRHAAVVRATGGILGSILDAADIDRAIQAIVQDAIGSAGYKLQKAPIGPSIKVALNAVRDASACSSTDIPRSRVNGFDFDGTAISFYGACRAPTVNTPAAVSYRYWVDSGTDPDGKAPCVDDPKYDPNEADHCQGNFACSAANACVCQQPAGGCKAGEVFDASAAVCACVPQFG